MFPAGGPCQPRPTYKWQEDDPRFPPRPGQTRGHYAMVKIIVNSGEYKKDFFVHRDMLTRYQVSLFENIVGFVGDFETFIVTERPQVFTGLLQYAYRGRFWLPQTVNSIYILWDIYFFAEKKHIASLQDVLMNRITSYYFKQNTFPDVLTVSQVYAHTRDYSAGQKQSVARRFIARCYVCISSGCVFGAKCKETPEEFAGIHFYTKGLHWDTLQATREPTRNPWKVELDPRDDRRIKLCDYHQHAENEKCPKYEETRFNRETDI